MSTPAGIVAASAALVPSICHEKHENPNHLNLPANKAAVTPFPPACPVLVYNSEGTNDINSDAGYTGSRSNVGGSYLAKVKSVYIDLGSPSRDSHYRVRPQYKHNGSDGSQGLLQSVPECALRYAAGCTVSVSAASLPSFVSESEGGGKPLDAKIISCYDIPSQDETNTTTSAHYLIDVVFGPSDAQTNMQLAVPSSALRYHPTCTTDIESLNSEKPEEDTNTSSRDAAAAAEANTGNFAPRTAVQVAISPHEDGKVGAGGGATMVSPHPPMMPEDDEAHENNPPNAGGAFSLISAAAVTADKIDSAIKASNLSGNSKDDALRIEAPISSAGHKRSRSADGDCGIVATKEEVVRRIDIPNTLDMNTVTDVLVGPNYKINQKIQSMFAVSIFILGLDGILEAPPSGSSIPLELLGKLGHLSPKPGDKCVMIRGSERKVYDASKVVIHLLVEKCYVGDDKDSLKKELRVVRQVRKKAPSPTALDRTASSQSTRPRESIEEPSAKKPAITATVNALAHADMIPAVQRGWSPTLSANDGISRPSLIGGHGSHCAQLPEHHPNNEDISDITDGSPFDSRVENWPMKFAKIDIKHPLGPMQLMIVPPFQDGSGYTTLIGSPIDHNMLFDIFVGKQSSKKRELEAMLHCNLWIEGGLPGDRDPLHMKISATDMATLDAAAERVAHTLYDTYEDRRLRVEDPMGLVMEGPFTAGKFWHIKVIVPMLIDENMLFATIIGRGGEKKKRLKAQFDLTDINLLGGGLEGFGRRSGKSGLKMAAGLHYPLHVDVWGPNRAAVEAATSSIATLLHDVASGLRTSACDHYAVDDGNSLRGGPQTEYMTDDPMRLIMADPYFDGNVVFRVMSPINEHLLVASIIGKRNEARKRIVEKFGLCNIAVQGTKVHGNDEETDADTLHVLIKGETGDRVSVGAAAKYIASTLNEMSRSTCHDESKIFRMGQCYWDAGHQQWALNIKPPTSEKKTFNIVMARMKWIKEQFRCSFVAMRGGEGDGFMEHRDYPFHVCIKDKSKIAVEDAAEYISKVLNEKAADDTREMSIDRHHDDDYHRPSSEAANYYGPKIPGRYDPSSSTLRPASVRGYRRPAQPAPVRSDKSACWTTTVWPPVEEYPYSNFLDRITGPQGSTQRQLEDRFGVKIDVWGHQGFRKEPLHFAITGQSYHGVDEAADYIAKMMIPSEGSGAEHEHKRRQSKDDPMRLINGGSLLQRY